MVSTDYADYTEICAICVICGYGDSSGGIVTVEAIFWLSVAAVGYAYVGYPLLLTLLSLVRPKPVRSNTWTPSVSVIIAAYNEERDLAAKLENTLALDYPKSNLEIIVTSDCSSDRTDEIARSFASRGVRLHRQEERHGKTAAQNAAVEKAQWRDHRLLRRNHTLSTRRAAIDDAVFCRFNCRLCYRPCDLSGREGVECWSWNTVILELRVLSQEAREQCLLVDWCLRLHVRGKKVSLRAAL